MVAPILETRNVSKAYPGVLALNDVSVAVDKGEVVALIGPNGAGKSTLFSVVCGDPPADKGQVLLRGHDITRVAPWKLTQMGVARAFQVARVFPRMTVSENLVTAIRTRERWAKEAALWQGFLRPRPCSRAELNHVLNEVGLSGSRDALSSTLAHGDKKRLEIGMALCLNPELLLLDEPTSGMSPSEAVETIHLIRKVFEERGITVFLTEHRMEVVYALAKRVVVLNQGSVIACGTPDEIRSDPRVREVYLGEEETSVAQNREP